MTRFLMTRFVTGGLCVALLCVAASANAEIVFQDDFESYTGWTANNGNGFFNSTNEPNYDANNWLPYYSYGAARDPGMVVASGGPHSGTSSGYGDSKGFTQWDGGTPHGQTHCIYADCSAVAAGKTATFSAYVNSVGATSWTRLQIASAGLTSSGAGDDISGANINSGGNNLQATAGGAEPSVSPSPDWSSGWMEVKVAVDIGTDGNVELTTASYRSVGGTWASISVGGSAPGQATHIGFDIGQGTTIDNIVVDVVPEPATLGMLSLGLCGLALMRRRR